MYVYMHVYIYVYMCTYKCVYVSDDPVDLSAICMHNFYIAVFLLTFAFTDADINMHVYK